VGGDVGRTESDRIAAAARSASQEKTRKRAGELKVEIKRCREYETNGCKFKGNLAIVEYWEESSTHSRSLPLEGFGRMSCFDFRDRAEKLILDSGLKIKEKLLGIPVLVVEIEED
jgi:hypothetical protein